MSLGENIHFGETHPVHLSPEQRVRHVHIIGASGSGKSTLLYNLITKRNLERVMVFANRRDETQFLKDLLAFRGIRCGLLSGDVSQEQRVRTLEAFREGKIKVLVATDVAARGLHIEGVSHVVNYSLPLDPQDYLHRIGRTGRAGASGISVSFRLKYKDPRCTILNYFATGRSIVVGAKTPNAAFYGLHQLRKYLSDDRKNAGIKFVSPPQVSNIVLAAMFDYSLNIAAMHAANSSKTNYVPREFSGACYRPFPQAEREGCKANIFEEGAYTILGGTNMEIAVQIADKIAELVRPFKVGGWQRRDVVGEREAEFKLEKRKYSEQAELREARRQKLLQRVALHESELSEENY